MNLKRGWGCIRLLPSENYQASYVGLDNKRYIAPKTFKYKKDAENFLSKKREEIETGTWLKQKNIKLKSIKFYDYAVKVIRTRNLSQNTRILYL